MSEPATGRRPVSEPASGSPVVRLGANTCFAVKRWPEPAHWAALVVEELGLDLCQVSLDLMDPGLDLSASGPYAEAAGRACEAAGLEVHSLFTGLAAYSANLLLHPDPAMREAATGWWERAITLAGLVGAAGVGGYLGALSVADAADPARRGALLDELGERFHHLASRAASAGLGHLLVENMAVRREPGSVIGEMHDLEDRAAGSAVPWVLCLDLGHPCALRTGTASDDPLAWLGERWRHRPVLQIQQANRDGDHHWPFTDERNAAGLLRPGPVVDVLRAGGGAAGGEGAPDEPGSTLAFFEVVHAAEADDGRVLADLRASVACWRAVPGVC